MDTRRIMNFEAEEARGRDDTRTKPAWLIAPSVATLMAIVLGGAAIGHLSPTIDEWYWIHIGVKHWFGGSSQILIDQLGTNPLALWLQNLTGAVYLKWTYGGLPGGLGIDFGKDLTLGDQRALLSLARWSNLLIAGPSTIWAVWLMTRRWFSAPAAAVAAVFCAVEPNLLASYVLGTADALMVPLAVLTMLAYDNYLQRRRSWKLLGLAVLFGLGAAVKILMLSHGLPLLAACFGTWIGGQILGRMKGGERLRFAAREVSWFICVDLVVILGLGLSLCWAFSGFPMGSLIDPHASNKLTSMIVDALGYRGDEARAIVAELRAIRVPGTISVIRTGVAHNHWGHEMSFMGKAAYHGPWYYYPYIFAMKTHLVLLGAVLVALLRPETWRTPISWSVVLLVAFSCTAKVHGGPRYFLVLYALMASLGGVGIAAVLRAIHPLAVRITVAMALVVVSLALTLRSTPDFLTHTSPLWGGDPAGYRYADANYDWGQGLYRAFAAADRAVLKPLSFIHSGDPFYGVPRERDVILPGPIPQMLSRMRGRFVAVSVFNLYHSPTAYSAQAPLYRALAALGPDGRLTNTYFYFDLRAAGRFTTLQRMVEREERLPQTSLSAAIR
jgi:hypothetical protein